MDEVLQNQSVPIKQPIKKNLLPLLKRPFARTSSKQKQQIASLKSDCSLFGRLYIASKFRDGNLEEFFSHENQHSPPALSEHGKLRIPSKKSDLLECMNISTSTEPPSSYHVKVVDGPAIVHALPTKQVKTFDDYCETVSLPWITHMLQNSDRIDIVWDAYKANSLFESTK